MGLSPVIITVRMPMPAHLGEAVSDAALDDVLEVDHAEDRAAVRHEQRRRTLARRGPPPPRRTLRRHLGRPGSRTKRAIASARALADRAGRRGPRRSSASGPRTARSARRGSRRSRPRRPNRSLARTTMLRPSGVSSASEASWAALGEVVLPHAGRGHEGDRLAVPERDGARSCRAGGRRRRRRPRPPGRRAPARWPGPSGPCRRCRWPRAARRSSSG